MGGHWAYHALHDDGRCHGMSEAQLKRLYRSASLLINYHGATAPLPEHSATGRLVLLETDPVVMEIELANNEQKAFDFLAQHSAFFSWGENYRNLDCKVPLPPHLNFRPTRAPIVLDLWQPFARGPADTFTTIGNWKQGGSLEYQGEVYHWSKHYEFLKFLDLPKRTAQPFELALSKYEEADRLLLESNGWKVRPALDFSRDLDAYREYVGSSRG